MNQYQCVYAGALPIELFCRTNTSNEAILNKRSTKCTANVPVLFCFAAAYCTLLKPCCVNVTVTWFTQQNNKCPQQPHRFILNQHHIFCQKMIANSIQEETRMKQALAFCAAQLLLQMCCVHSCGYFCFHPNRLFVFIFFYLLSFLGTAAKSERVSGLTPASESLPSAYHQHSLSSRYTLLWKTHANTHVCSLGRARAVPPPPFTWPVRESVVSRL